MTRLVLLANVAATLYMTGLIWFVQVVRGLVAWNWLRTVAWTGRAVIVGAMLWAVVR